MPITGVFYLIACLFGTPQHSNKCFSRTSAAVDYPRWTQVGAVLIIRRTFTNYVSEVSKRNRAIASIRSALAEPQARGVRVSSICSAI